MRAPRKVWRPALAAAVAALLCAVAPSVSAQPAAGDEGDLYAKAVYELTLQLPKAKIIDESARRRFVLREMYSRACACFAGLFVNDERLAMHDDPEAPGIVAASRAVFLVGEFESRACPYRYFVLSFRHPAWPEPVRSESFGDCREPRSLAFGAAGGITIRFAGETVAFKDGVLTRK